jgi:hypothetical protein
MAARKRTPGKKYFTVQEANATLPLVRAIVKDITALAHELRDRHQRLGRSRSGHDQRGAPSAAHQEEIQHAQEALEQARERLGEFERELLQLGVELKDYFAGLVDFPAWMDGREVYLCWRQGETDVSHWHELEAGFAGRQKLTVSSGAP